VMWIAPFDSVVISLKAVIELSCGGILRDSACWLWKVRLRVQHCTVLVVCLLRVWLGAPICDILN